MVTKSHYASVDISSRVTEHFQLWNELKQATAAKTVGLDEALSLQQFQRRVETVQVLIADRVSNNTTLQFDITISIQVAVASTKEVGQDLEHCQALIKKFDGFEKVGLMSLVWNMLTCHVILYCRSWQWTSPM